MVSRCDQDLHHSIARAARSRFLAETAAYLLMLSDWVWHQYFMLKGSNPLTIFATTPLLTPLSSVILTVRTLR